MYYKCYRLALQDLEKIFQLLPRPVRCFTIIIDKLFIACSPSKDLWLVGLTVTSFIPKALKKYWHRLDIKAGSWSVTICVGDPKYLIKVLNKTLQTSGALLVFVYSTSMKLETLHSRANMNL